MKQIVGVSTFAAGVAALIPDDHFHRLSAHDGRFIWVHGGDVWTLDYTVDGADVNNLVLRDERRIVDVALFKTAVLSLPAVLKALGAVGDV